MPALPAAALLPTAASTASVAVAEQKQRGDDDQQQPADLDAGEPGLRRRAGADAAQVDPRQHEDDGRRIEGRPVGAERQHLRQVVAEDERQQRDRAGGDDREARPCEQERHVAPIGAVQEVVVAARMRIGGGELGIAQRADQRHQAAERPRGEHPQRAAGHAGDHGRRLEDAGADDDADDDGDGLAQAQHRARFGSQRNDRRRRHGRVRAFFFGAQRRQDTAHFRGSQVRLAVKRRWRPVGSRTTPFMRPSWPAVPLKVCQAPLASAAANWTAPAGDLRLAQRQHLGLAPLGAAFEMLVVLLELDVQPVVAGLHGPHAADVGRHGPHQRAAFTDVGDAVRLPVAHRELMRRDARAGFHAQQDRHEPRVQAGQQVQRDDVGVGEVGLEDVALHELHVLHRLRLGVALRHLDHRRVVFDAQRLGAAPRRRDGDLAVAGAEIDHVFAGAHPRHVEHRPHHLVGRRHPDHVLAGLADDRLERLHLRRCVPLGLRLRVPGCDAAEQRQHSGQQSPVANCIHGPYPVHRQRGAIGVPCALRQNEPVAGAAVAAGRYDLPQDGGAWPGPPWCSERQALPRAHRLPPDRATAPTPHDALPRPVLRLRRHDRPPRDRVRQHRRRLAEGRRIRPAARPGHRTRARRPAARVSAPRPVRARRGGERRAALHARNARRKAADRSGARAVRAAAARTRRGAAVGRPRHRRDLGAERDRRVPRHPRARPRAAGDLQQGRGDGAAVRRQQGQRARRGAAVDGTVAAQRRRRRRRRERPRLPDAVRMLGGGRECAAGAEGDGRHRHGARPRRRRRRADRRADRRRPRAP